MADLTVQVVDQQVVVQPFGSDALVPLVAAANQALADAEAAAAAASASVGAVKQNITAFLGADTGIVEGAWYAEYFVPVATTFTSFKGILISGTGTFELRVLVNDVDVYGPRTISSTLNSATISLAVAANDRVSFQVNNITGTPILAEIQLLGLPT